MRRTISILIIAALSAHAIDCIRPMFEYFASHYKTEALNPYILPGNLKPDSLHRNGNPRFIPSGTTGPKTAWTA